MIRRAYHFARREAPMFGRFIIVGGLSFLINFVLYALFSRWLFPQGNKVVENAVAFLLSVIFNFAAHRAWTYRGERTNLPQLIRYGLVTGSGAVLQSGIFWLGHEQLRIYDYLVIVAATGIASVFTFLGHRFFTFRSRTASPSIS